MGPGWLAMFYNQQTHTNPPVAFVISYRDKDDALNPFGLPEDILGSDYSQRGSLQIGERIDGAFFGTDYKGNVLEGSGWIAMCYRAAEAK